MKVEVFFTYNSTNDNSFSRFYTILLVDFKKLVFLVNMKCDFNDGLIL